MKEIIMTPKAHQDLLDLKQYLLEEFGEKCTKEIIDSIYADLDNLMLFPNMGVDLLSRYGITSNYLCLITNKNYAFYRIEDDTIKVIRILDERRNFLRILFGISIIDEDFDNMQD